MELGTYPWGDTLLVLLLKPERERQTERETERDRQRERQRETDREREGEIRGEKENWKYEVKTTSTSNFFFTNYRKLETGRQTDRQTDRDVYR